jgi:hypothetical protein
MGDHVVYLPGVLVHWTREGRNTLHHKSKTCPQTLLFGFTRPTPPRPLLEQHPAFQSQAKMDSPIPASPDASQDPFDASASARLTPLPVPAEPTLRDIAKLIDHDQAFENTSTSVAASQMRNALNNLADTVQDPDEKKVGALCTYYINSS